MKPAKLLRIPMIALGSLLTICCGWACSTYGPSQAGLNTEAAKEAPKIFNESPVPEGWPALTPINQIRVKEYPAYRAAIILADNPDNATPNGLFRPLFNHIKRKDIAMTAPVEMTYLSDGSQSSMAFLYRTTDMGTPGTDKDDSRILVKDMPAQTVVSIGLKGSYSHSNYASAIDKLNTWLKENPGYRAAGEPRYLGYNSPFIPSPMRYGEVQLPIKPAK